MITDKLASIAVELRREFLWCKEVRELWRDSLESDGDDKRARVKQLMLHVKTLRESRANELREIAKETPELASTLHRLALKLETSSDDVSDDVCSVGHETRTPGKRVEIVEGGINIDGELVALKPKQVSLVQCLVNASGEYVSLSNESFRTRDVEKLPAQVKLIIDSQPGAGTRILPQWLN